jgi:hypothetical protein
MSDQLVTSAMTESPVTSEMTACTVHPSGWWKASDGTWYPVADRTGLATVWKSC